MLSLLTGYKVRNIIHGTGPVEGVHSNEVFETLRFQALQPLLHALRFKLEHGRGVSAAVKLQRGLIVNRDGLNVNVFPVMLLNQIQAIVDNLERNEPQEVHF